MKRKDTQSHRPASHEGGPGVAGCKTPGGPFRDPAGPAPSGPRHFVCFQLNRQYYALPLENVDRALRMVAVIPVPEMPAWIAGVINIHGRVVAVADLRRKFGLAPKAAHPDHRLIVMKSRNRPLALAVDRVTGVLETTAGQVAWPAALEAGGRPLPGIIRQEEKLILILDPDRLQAPKIPGDGAEYFETLRGKQG